MNELIAHLGQPVDGNTYTIEPIDGEWWLMHNKIGSGEPLKQLLATTTTEGIKKFFADKKEQVVQIGAMELGFFYESIGEAMLKLIGNHIQTEVEFAFKFPPDERTLSSILSDVFEWQDKTFPAADPLSKLHHLKEEVEELIFAVFHEYCQRDIEREFADCFLLLFGAADKSGLSLKDINRIMLEKMEINKARSWGEPDKNGVVKHVKEGGE